MEETKPTSGFNLKSVEFQKRKLSLWDIGGSVQYR
jgi:hypothetical protein